MKRRRLLINIFYVLIVACTAGFAFYQYKKSEHDQQAEEKKNLIFPNLELAEVQEISLEKAGVDIQLLHQDEGWKLLSPVEDLADVDLVENYLESLLSEKIRIIKDSGVDWAEYGLNQNTAVIDIVKKGATDDQKMRLEVSHYSAFDGSFYIRKGAQLLLGDTSWASLTQKKGDDFRSYKLLGVKKHPVSVSYHSKPFTAQLLWGRGAGWRWKGERNRFPLSHSDLESYWSALSNVNFEKDPHSDTEKLRKRFKLSSPAVELKMEFKNNKTWSVKISPEVKGKFYAVVSDRNYIFTLNKDHKKDILLNENKIRDHRQPFRFKKDDLYFIELKGYGVDIKLEKKQDKWELLSVQTTQEGKTNNLDSATKGMTTKTKARPPAKTQAIEWELDRKKLKNVLDKISFLSAKKYFGDKKPFAKTAYFALKNKQQKEILRVDLSLPYKTKKTSTKESKKLVYAKSSLGKEVMALRFKDIEPIFSPSLLKPYKAENEEDAEKGNGGKK